MAKWSVALMGFQKFIPNEQDDPVEYTAAIKRAKPGDIVACKLWDSTVQWTPRERSEFLIVTINDLIEEQIPAICEQEWDLNSYPTYNPHDNASWRAQLIDYWNNMRQEQRYINIARWNSLSVAEQDSLYSQYTSMEKDNCRMPTNYIKKRRFTFNNQDLQAKGVNINKMLDRNLLYDPRPEFNKLYIYDLKNNRKILNTDGLNTIHPLTDNELVIL